MQLMNMEIHHCTMPAFGIMTKLLRFVFFFVKAVFRYLEIYLHVMGSVCIVCRKDQFSVCVRKKILLIIWKNEMLVDIIQT